MQCFTMGAEVSGGFVGLGHEGSHTRAWKGGHTSMIIKMDVYRAAATIAGRLIVRAVDMVQRATQRYCAARGQKVKRQSGRRDDNEADEKTLKQT